MENGNNIEYSILNNPGCTVSITNKAEQGSSISVTIDGQTIDNISNYSLSDGDHYLKIIISKTGHNEVKIEKKINVSFKPVTVTLYQCNILSDTGDAEGRDYSDIYGTIYIGSTNTTWQKLISFSDKHIQEDGQFHAYDPEIFFYTSLSSLTDWVGIYTEGFIEEDTGVALDDDIPDIEMTNPTSVTLKDFITAYKSNFIPYIMADVGVSGENRVVHYMTFSISD